MTVALNRVSPPPRYRNKGNPIMQLAPQGPAPLQMTFALAEMAMSTMGASGLLEFDEIDAQIRSGVPYSTAAQNYNKMGDRLKLHTDTVHEVNEKKNQIISNSAVPPGSNIVIDPFVLRPYRAPTTIYDMCQRKGLIEDWPMGTMLPSYDRSGNGPPPQVGLSMVSNNFVTYQSANNMVYATREYSVVPYLFHQFTLSQQQIDMTRNRSNLLAGKHNLEYDQLDAYSQSLYEAVEEVIFYGANVSVSVMRQKVECLGLYNSPSLPAANVTLDVTDPTAFIGVINDLTQQVANVPYKGPYVLFVSQNLQSAFSAIITPSFATNTISGWIKEHVTQIAEVHFEYFLNAYPLDTSINPLGYFVLFPLHKDVFDLALVAPPQTVMTMANPVYKQYIMFAAMTPRVKIDAYEKTAVQTGTIQVVGRSTLAVTYDANKPTIKGRGQYGRTKELGEESSAP